VPKASTKTSAVPFVPPEADLDGLRAAATGCEGCGLYRDATQTVFGTGPGTAKVVMVGEQPGDKEDVAGEPFVGPAGRLLDKVLDEAGIDRREVYVTNAVKHFKFKLDANGKRRIHQTPSRTEVVACRPWLLAELGAVRPGLVVCLGATAAKSLFGADFRITQHRGEILDLPALDGVPAAKAVVTAHPSAVLRAPDRQQAYGLFLADMKVAASAMDG
jgi:uracil-DNA glycosylase family protein